MEGGAIAIHTRAQDTRLNGYPPRDIEDHQAASSRERNFSWDDTEFVIPVVCCEVNRFMRVTNQMTKHLDTFRGS